MKTRGWQPRLIFRGFFHALITWASSSPGCSVNILRHSEKHFAFGLIEKVEFEIKFVDFLQLFILNFVEARMLKYCACGLFTVFQYLGARSGEKNLYNPRLCVFYFLFFFFSIWSKGFGDTNSSNEGTSPRERLLPSYSVKSIVNSSWDKSQGLLTTFRSLRLDFSTRIGSSHEASQ